MELRTLPLSDAVPGFEYSYIECVKKFLGVCTKTEMKFEYFDLTKPEVRRKLIDMGFVARVREKPLP